MAQSRTTGIGSRGSDRGDRTDWIGLAGNRLVWIQSRSRFSHRRGEHGQNSIYRDTGLFAHPPLLFLAVQRELHGVFSPAARFHTLLIGLDHQNLWSGIR
jgi:hypothetical protein